MVDNPNELRTQIAAVAAWVIAVRPDCEVVLRRAGAQRNGAPLYSMTLRAAGIGAVYDDITAGRVQVNGIISEHARLGLLRRMGDMTRTGLGVDGDTGHALVRRGEH